MGHMFRVVLISSLLFSTPAFSSQCEQLFCSGATCSTNKLKPALKATLFFSSATAFIWGGLELSKTLEQNQVIFAGIVAGAIVFGFFNSLVTPVLLPLQNKVQRMSFRMLHNTDLPTTIKHKRLHDFWRDNNTHFGPNESMGRNHYTATLGKAFHRITYAHEQFEKGKYEYAIAVLKDLLMELKYYPEIFPHDKELQNYIKTHIQYLEPEIKKQARHTMEQMAKEDPEFAEVSRWALEYLDL